MRNAGKVSAVSAFLLVTIPHQTVQAYIDPGTASYAFQIVAGAVLGGLFLVKTYWQKLKASVRDGISRVGRAKA